MLRLSWQVVNTLVSERKRWVGSWPSEQLRRPGPSCHLVKGLLRLHRPYRTHDTFLQVCENRTHTCLRHPECPGQRCVVRLGGKIWLAHLLPPAPLRRQDMDWPPPTSPAWGWLEGPGLVFQICHSVWDQTQGTGVTFWEPDKSLVLKKWMPGTLSSWHSTLHWREVLERKPCRQKVSCTFDVWTCLPCSSDLHSVSEGSLGFTWIVSRSCKGHWPL